MTSVHQLDHDRPPRAPTSSRTSPARRERPHGEPDWLVEPAPIERRLARARGEIAVDDLARHARYERRLVALADALGFEVASARLRFDRLRSPTSRRRGTPSTMPPSWCDHPRWLRRGPGRRPEQWILACSIYHLSATEADDLDDLTARLGATWALLGDSPYGAGTRLLLVVGRSRDAGEEGARIARRNGAETDARSVPTTVSLPTP